MEINFNTELDVYEVLKAKIKADVPFIKEVYKFTDMVSTIETLSKNEIWCAIDFLPKKNKTISGTRENVVLFHLFIGHSKGDGLYIADEQLRRALNGFSKDLILRTIYDYSSDLFKEKKWDAWTRHLRVTIEWKSEK